MLKNTENIMAEHVPFKPELSNLPFKPKHTSAHLHQIENICGSKIKSKDIFCLSKILKCLVSLVSYVMQRTKSKDKQRAKKNHLYAFLVV